jgi:2-desacetyl-2-hydroxyethyl bacteriochlorophyllide A dehydrogenase
MHKYNILGLKFKLNLINNLISFIYYKITNKIYLGPFSALSTFKINNYQFKVKNDDVVVKTSLCGFCGTDKKILTYDYSFFSSAFLQTNKKKDKEIFLGHEVFGKVVDKGSSVKNLRIGDSVILDSMNRDYNISNNIFGGWTNYFLRNEKQLIKIDNIKPEQAILIEPLACAFEAAIKFKIHRNSKILIIGMGTIGLALNSILKFMYKDKLKIHFFSNSKKDNVKIKKGNIPKVHLSDNIIISTAKLLKTEIVESFGNQITVDGFDYIFDTSGSNNLIHNILRITKKKSKIILMGMNMKKFKFDPTPIWLNELEIVSTHGYNLNFKKYNLLKHISWLIFKNKIDIDYLNTEKFSFNNYEKFINEKNDMIKKKTVTFN